MRGRLVAMDGSVEVDAAEEAGVLFERLVVCPISASLGGTVAPISLLEAAILTTISLLYRGLKGPFRCRVLVRVFVGGVVGVGTIRGKERVIGWYKWLRFIGA